MDDPCHLSYRTTNKRERLACAAGPQLLSPWQIQTQLPLTVGWPCQVTLPASQLLGLEISTVTVHGCDEG